MFSEFLGALLGGVGGTVDLRAVVLKSKKRGVLVGKRL